MPKYVLHLTPGRAGPQSTVRRDEGSAEGQASPEVDGRSRGRKLARWMWRSLVR
jgi:hypothetical protein